MNEDQTAVPVRLSKTQMSVIWPGLNFMVLAWLTRQKTGTCLTEYPFRLYPLPPGSDIGTFNSEMMNRICGLWARLKPMAKTGGQVRLNAIEVRIAILSARVNLKSRRHQAQKMRRKDSKTKLHHGVDKDSIAKLRRKTRPVIKSLGTAMKKANRRFIKLLSKKDLENQSEQWQAHLLWMQYHILYFKLGPPGGPGRPWVRQLQQKWIDQLVAAAEAGLQEYAYEFPSKEELRRVMRLYAQYSRRGRMGEEDHFRSLLKEPESWNTQYSLVEFLEKHLDLKRVPDEPAMTSG